jgi:hypothetical protein
MPNQVSDLIKVRFLEDENYKAVQKKQMLLKPLFY